MEINDVPLELAKIALMIDRMPADTPRWLDAPTCEGFYWFKDGHDSERQLEVVEVYKMRGSNELRFSFCSSDEMCRLPDNPMARWYGPIVPPESDHHVKCEAFVCLPEVNPSHYDARGRHYSPPSVPPAESPTSATPSGDDTSR